jgi:diadenosine tetraphosphatase ApaH/serine/threonine PP2A family protein phosphatase
MTTPEPRRIAVFSDVHSNLHALRAVLAAIDELGIKSMVCCGDVVGYGAFPNECIELLRERHIPTLAGNHDHAALGMTDVQYFNDIAKAAVYWTRDQLIPENAQWLRQRPYTYALGDRFFFVHASPYQPEQWGYVLTFGDARLAFEQFRQTFCFIGHSHQPAVVIKRGEDLTCPEESSVIIEPEYRYLVNVGSVGQPRDHNPDASFVVVDLDRSLINFQRVPYPVGAAQEAIRLQGLPNELAERLGYGW